MAVPKRVLIVDDSSTMREHIRGLLTDEFECLAEADGAAAFQTAQRELPDCIVTDLHMPNSGGLELLKALRAEPRTQAIPVIIVTTVTAVDKVNEARALGCVGFVLKPVQKEYLLAKLRQLTR